MDVGWGEGMMVGVFGDGRGGNWVWGRWVRGRSRSVGVDYWDNTKP